MAMFCIVLGPIYIAWLLWVYYSSCITDPQGGLKVSITPFPPNWLLWQPQSSIYKAAILAWFTILFVSMVIGLSEKMGLPLCLEMVHIFTLTHTLTAATTGFLGILITSPSSRHISQQRMPGISPEIVVMDDPLQELLLESQRARNDVNELIDLYSLMNKAVPDMTPALERDRLSDSYQSYKPLIPNFVLENFPILTHDDILTTNCGDVCKQIDHDLQTMDSFLRLTIAEEISKALTQAEKHPYLQDIFAIANQRIPYITSNILNIIRSRDQSYVSPNVGDEVLTDQYKASRNKNTTDRHLKDYVLLHKIRDYIQKLIIILE